MVKIYFHIAKINNWASVTEYFFNSIFSCGLYDACDEIKIGMVGDNLDQLDLNLFKKNKIKVFKKGDLLNYEFPTIQMLYEDSLSKDFKCLYFHTKGVSFNDDRWENEKEILKKQYHKRQYTQASHVKKAYKYTRYWTRNFLIKNYKQCVSHLEKHDIVCLTKAHNENFIPINFWWSKSSYIRNLKYPNLEKDRYDAELWICKNKNKKIKSFLGQVDEYKKIKFL